MPWPQGIPRMNSAFRGVTKRLWWCHLAGGEGRHVSSMHWSSEGMPPVDHGICDSFLAPRLIDLDSESGNECWTEILIIQNF